MGGGSDLPEDSSGTDGAKRIGGLVRGSKAELVMMGLTEQQLTEWVEWREQTTLDWTRLEVAPSNVNDQSLSEWCAADCADDLIHQLTIQRQD